MWNPADWNGKTKAVTFSYDDAVHQDARLIGLFNDYGCKGTFNLNSGLLGKENTLDCWGVTVRHDKWRPEEVAGVYRGHEVAVHTVTHPNLTKLTPEDARREIDEDRKALSALVGYDVVGMAYPSGGVNFNEAVADVVRTTPVKYARTTVSTNAFDLQDDLYVFRPSVHHSDYDALFALARAFVDSTSPEPQLFYVWGHSYEFDAFDQWSLFEDFLKDVARRDDVFYGTNRQVFGL